MATGLYGKNYNTSGGGPGSAGTNETQVDRINEGLSGEYTTTNNGATFVATRGNFDTFKAIGTVSRQMAQIDTSGTSGITPWKSLQNAAPPAYTHGPGSYYNVPAAAATAEALITN